MQTAIRNASLTIALAVSLIAGGEASAEPPVKSVGIVADWGDTIHYLHKGFTSFSDTEQKASVPAWGIDAYLGAELEAALKQGYNLRTVTFARGTIAPNIEDDFWGLPSPKENVRKNAKSADGTPIDAYLVIWPARDHWAQLDTWVSGIGLLTSSGSVVPGKNGAWIHAVGVISLVDGRTFEEIDKCFLEVPASAFAVTEGYARRADDLNVEGFEKLTQEQEQRFETAIKALLHDEVAHCLRKLRLTRAT